MRKKRFSHHVDIFCEMFCGWRLTNCYDRLTEMGSGDYEINILTGECKRDGAPIAPLSIAGELTTWLKEDMLKEQIDLSLVSIANIRAKLIINRLEGKRRTNVVFPGREAADYICCRFACESSLESDSDHYTAKKDDYREWPYPLSTTTRSKAEKK